MTLEASQSHPEQVAELIDGILSHDQSLASKPVKLQQVGDDMVRTS